MSENVGLTSVLVLGQATVQGIIMVRPIHL